MFLHESLSECKDAHFTPDGGCLENTRADLLRQVGQWLDNTDEARPNVFWLHGKAGSGKSTVANTVAQMAKASGHGFRLSCFFCKRDDPALSSPKKVLPTLAYSFAQQYESYRAAITVFFQGSDGAGIGTTADLKTQFDKLFAGPLKATIDPLRPHVIVIDALDECGSPEDQNRLAAEILALSRVAPWLKVFITSRDEPKIRSVFSQTSNCISHNINDEQGIDSDINLYIECRAAELDLSLSPEDVHELVKQADGLFIWCRTLFAYLRENLGARYLLTQVLSGKKQPKLTSHPWSQLSSLYDTILDSAVARQEADVSFMRALLSIINIATGNRPLSVKAVVSLLHGQGLHTQFDDGDAENVIKKLHAVLYVDGSANGALRAYHASFYDFLAWKASMSAESGWETLGAIHRLMAHGCLNTLRQELKFNICKIEIPVLNTGIHDLDARVSALVSDALQYSSRFWFTHLSPSTLTAIDVERDVLELLRSAKLLFLYECLSLQGCLRQVEFACLTCLKSFFQVC